MTEGNKTLEMLDLSKRAMEAFNRRDFDVAIDLYTKVISLNPDRAVAYSTRINRGSAHHMKGEFDLAIADCNAAIELKSDSAEAHGNRGSAYFGKKELDRAIKDFGTAIDLDPHDASAYYNRGKVYNERGDHDRAIEDFNTAIRLNPIHAPAYIGRGNAFSEKGEYDRAIEDYNRAIDLDPRHVESYHNRALAIARKEPREIADEYKKLYDKQLKEALDKREQDLRELLSRYEAPEKVVKRFLDREEKYTSLVDALDKEVKEFSASLPFRLCKQTGVPVLALSLLLLALSLALQPESSYLWILLPLLPLTLAVLSYPSISHLRHLREKRNRLEVCREDYFRKGTMAEYIIFAGISDDSKKHQAITIFLDHLGDRSAAEFLSEWGKSAKDKDDKISWKSIIENNPVSPGAGDDRQV